MGKETEEKKMESEIPVKLPVIYFSNIDLKGRNAQWDAVRSQVHKALVEFGCFEVLFDRVPLELQEATFAALKELFDLPLQTKQQNVSQTLFHGYSNPETLPLYESLGIVDANVTDKLESFTNSMWPQGNPNFRLLGRWFWKLSLGVEKYTEEHMNSTYYLLRVRKYNTPQTNEKRFGLWPHTDKCILTILYQNLVDGNWINYKPSPNSFIVVVGDSFHAWTNVRLHSPKHHVMMSGNEVRYSLAMITNPKKGYIVKAPEELVDEKHPLLFKPFDYFDLLEFYATEEGRKAESTLRAYCGV